MEYIFILFLIIVAVAGFAFTCCGDIFNDLPDDDDSEENYYDHM